MSPIADDLLIAAAVLVSLDLSLPFWEEMGLRVAHPQAIQAEIRKVWQANDKAQMLRPGTARSWLAAVEDRHGAETAGRLSNWMLQRFARSPSDQPHWNVWEACFHKWAFVDDACPAFSHAKAELILADYRVMLSLGEIEPFFARARTKPLSDWDQFVYALYDYSNDDEVRSPLTEIEFTIGIHRFQQFWAGWAPRWTSDERRQLHHYALTIAAERGYWLPDPLYSPDQMTELLSRRR